MKKRAQNLDRGVPLADGREQNPAGAETAGALQRSLGCPAYRPAPPGVAGAKVEPLGEGFIRLFPEGLRVLLAPAAALPALALVLPFTAEPVVTPLVDELPAAVPAVPPAAPPWANAKLLESASAEANAIVVSFMITSLHLTLRPVSDVSDELLRLGLSRGAPLPVVIASPEFLVELPVVLAPLLGVATDFSGTVPDPEPPTWAKAKELERVTAAAKVIVLSFIVVSCH